MSIQVVHPKMKILSSFINFHFPKLVWFSVFLRAQKEMFGWMFTARCSFAYSESEWCLLSLLINLMHLKKSKKNNLTNPEHCIRRMKIPNTASNVWSHSMAEMANRNYILKLFFNKWCMWNAFCMWNASCKWNLRHEKKIIWVWI